MGVEDVELWYYCKTCLILVRRLLGRAEPQPLWPLALSAPQPLSHFQPLQIFNTNRATARQKEGATAQQQMK